MPFAESEIFKDLEESPASEEKTRDQLDLWALLAAIDRRDLGYYDLLSSRHKKQFSGFMSLMWISYAEGNSDLQSYYIQSSNLAVNQHLFDINHHPKLQYLCLCAASPGLGKIRHSWIKSKKSITDTKKKTLMKLFPMAKLSDIELLGDIVSDSAVQTYIQSLGEGGLASL